MARSAQHSVRPQFRLAVHRERGKNRGKRFARSRGADFHRLLDYVHTLGSNPLAEEPSCGPFARAVFSNHPRSPGQPSGESRTNCALQIDADVVALSP